MNTNPLSSSAVFLAVMMLLMSSCSSTVIVQTKPGLYVERMGHCQLKRGTLRLQTITTEKECLAIVWSVDKFNHYLFGTRFHILSDHRPLVWLYSVEDPGAKLLRWRLQLNNYDYKIDYTPGKTNYVADELSRNKYRGILNRFSDEKIISSVFQIDAGNDSDDEENNNEDDDA